ncbi:hypothetical protein K438DRAFT_1773462 [Mycena galopus ATCC 62051]|nr:hypothetical protein K438DRAFT_1773462 [Mycena galopus ATCC 62051]
MATLDEIYKLLADVPGLKEAISMDKAMKFVRLGAQLKDEIIVRQSSSYDPFKAPSELPEHVHAFLGTATDMPEEFVSGCWTAFSETIWTYNNDGSSSGNDAQMFREFGLNHLLGIAIQLPLLHN